MPIGDTAVALLDKELGVELVHARKRLGRVAGIAYAFNLGNTGRQHLVTDLGATFRALDA